MKKGDIVLIEADKDKLLDLGVSLFATSQILENPRGIIFWTGASICEVRTALGIWTLPKEIIHATGEREEN